MHSVTKILATLVLMAAVLAYTVYNFITGKTDLTMFLVFAAIIGIPFVNLINLLIQELRKK